MDNPKPSRKEQMEHIAPPPQPKLGPDDAREATDADRNALAPAKSIAGAAKLFNNACTGGDSYNNNCAHFLSDCFLRSGYSELEAPAPCINARCATTAKRPIRARDMWCWFQDKATETRNTLPKNEGFWAIFQLDESVYWGGHVIIFDSDNNVYYGTNHFPAWTQHCYKW